MPPKTDLSKSIKVKVWNCNDFTQFLEHLSLTVVRTDDNIQFQEYYSSIIVGNKSS